MIHAMQYKGKILLEINTFVIPFDSKLPEFAVT